MARTTPPRPMDITEVFPELAGMARTATRLHPSIGRGYTLQIYRCVGMPSHVPCRIMQ